MSVPVQNGNQELVYQAIASGARLIGDIERLTGLDPDTIHNHVRRLSDVGRVHSRRQRSPGPIRGCAFGLPTRAGLAKARRQAARGREGGAGMSERATIMIDGIEFWLGQRWREHDPRSGNRVIEIVEIDVATKRLRIRSPVLTRGGTWAQARRFNGRRGGYGRAA